MQTSTSWPWCLSVLQWIYTGRLRSSCAHMPCHRSFRTWWASKWTTGAGSYSERTSSYYKPGQQVSPAPPALNMRPMDSSCSALPNADGQLFGHWQVNADHTAGGSVPAHHVAATCLHPRLLQTNAADLHGDGLPGPTPQSLAANSPAPWPVASPGNYVTWPAWENWNVFQFNWCFYSS